MRRLLPIALLFAIAEISSANLFLINSPASYLLANGEAPLNALTIDLNANGFFAGQTVLLKRGGAYNEFGGPAPTAFGLSALFSSNSVILPVNNLNRVPGAIDAGVDFFSPNTLIGNLSTDIAEDFEVDNFTGTANGVVLTIPAGAQFLIAAAEDNFFTDNNNTPEFYISIQHTPVPEPAPLAALGLGLACLLRRKKK